MSERINAETIRSFLQTELIGEPIIILNRVSSTNEYARDQVDLHGAVILAEEQTAGKGRLGRSWISPPGQSILMTVVFLPEGEIRELLPLTLAVGVAVAEGIEGMSELTMNLRWPNDVFAGNRKISGILVESQLSGAEAVKLIVGIGVNVHQEAGDFPEGLRYPATSLRMEGVDTRDRNQLVGSILNHLERRYNQIIAGESARIISDWKTHSDQLNTMVQYSREDTMWTGEFVDIDATGTAVVRDENGEEHYINSGDLYSPDRG